MVALQLVLASFFALVYANPVKVVHERRTDVPDGYVLTSAAPADATLDLRIALVQGDIAGLEAALYDVSTPSSDSYGDHLSKDAVEKYVTPAPETIAAVHDWLAQNDLESTTITDAGDWISVSMPVSKANELFDAEFSVFTHEGSNTETIRTLAYSLPAVLKDAVELIHPTTSFPDPSVGLPIISTPMTDIIQAGNSSNVTDSAQCASVITPACLQALYGIPAIGATQSRNKLAVSGFIQQFANRADLKLFLQALRPDLPSSTTFTLQTLDGGSDPQNPSQAGLEANLDIQYTIGIASGVPTTFISVGNNYHDGALGGFLDIINFLLHEPEPPNVLTTSYDFNEKQLPRALANNLCNAYLQLSARGTSILFSSGDGGVAGTRKNQCTTFVPTFPSGCPFVTVVGSTGGISPEVGSSFSAGGFSNYFQRPSYQAGAVSSYLSTIGSLYAGKYNRGGRAYPDVAAQGENIEIALDGRGTLVQGTSASTPIFASIIALLNDQLIARGRRPLGFLNPFLYSPQGVAAFTDITSGSNSGCGTNGFRAKAGWDPVTGLGTPNFAKLKRALKL